MPTPINLVAECDSKLVRLDFEKVMAEIVTAPPRLRIGLRLRNHALSGAETWTPAANAPIQTTALRWALA